MARMRTKPYRKRKPYKRKSGGGKFMLRGNAPLRSLPTKEVVLEQLMTMIPLLLGRRTP